jgi:hypothetical protein
MVRSFLCLTPNGRASAARVLVEVHAAHVEHQFGVLFDEHHDVLLAEQGALADAPTLYGVPSRDRDRGSELDRLLGVSSHR